MAVNSVVSICTEKLTLTLKDCSLSANLSCRLIWKEITFVIKFRISNSFDIIDIISDNNLKQIISRKKNSKFIDFFLVSFWEEIILRRKKSNDQTSQIFDSSLKLSINQRSRNVYTLDVCYINNGYDGNGDSNHRWESFPSTHQHPYVFVRWPFEDRCVKEERKKQIQTKKDCLLCLVFFFLI